MYIQYIQVYNKHEFTLVTIHTVSAYSSEDEEGSRCDNQGYDSRQHHVTSTDSKETKASK